MPGEASLEAGEYYAFRHNSFWPILRSLLRMPQAAGYDARLRALQAAGFALWDVLAECRREGSLDASIEHASARANDIAGLLRAHRHISLICLNGSTAATLFRRHVRKAQDLPAHVQVVTLPSTSPANARLNLQAKQDAWHAVLAPRLQAVRSTACRPGKGGCR